MDIYLYFVTRSHWDRNENRSLVFGNNLATVIFAHTVFKRARTTTGTFLRFRLPRFRNRSLPSAERKVSRRDGNRTDVPLLFFSVDRCWLGNGSNEETKRRTSVARVLSPRIIKRDSRFLRGGDKETRVARLRGRFRSSFSRYEQARPFYFSTRDFRRFRSFDVRLFNFPKVKSLTFSRRPRPRAPPREDTSSPGS